MRKRGGRSFRGTRAPSSPLSQGQRRRDDDVAMAQQATQAGRAGKRIPSAVMLAVQRTAGNAAATGLATPVQRFSLKKKLKVAGQVVAGPYGRLAYEKIKEKRAKGKSPGSSRRKKGAYTSELFGREATKAELEKVASIVVQSVKSSKSIEDFHSSMLVDLKASTRMAVHRRLSLLYVELYMQRSWKVRDLQQALQNASYLKGAKAPGRSAGDYVQGVFDGARDTLQDKTAPAKEEQKKEEQEKDPMERIAESLEALMKGKAAAGKGSTKAVPSPGGGAKTPSSMPSSAGSDIVEIPSWFFDEDAQGKASTPSTARPAVKGDTSGGKASGGSGNADAPTLPQATQEQLEEELKRRKEQLAKLRAKKKSAASDS